VSPPSAERSAELTDNYNTILKEVSDAAAAHPGKFKVSIVQTRAVRSAGQGLTQSGAGLMRVAAAGSGEQAQAGRGHSRTLQRGH